MGKLAFDSYLNFSSSISEKKTFKNKRYMNGIKMKNENLPITTQPKPYSNFSNLINTQKYENVLNDFFDDFYNDIKNSKRGIFIYGKSGVGKTHLIREYLKNNNYDPIFYEPHEQRNKSSIRLDNLSNTRVNVLNMFKKEQKKVVIIIDEIENMNNGDKTGITSLIKSLKIKKNQKKDVKNINPIICISSTNSEKKIKELMDVCKVINIDEQPKTVIHSILSEEIGFTNKRLLNIVSGNLHKLKIILKYFSQIGFDENTSVFINHFFDSSESTKEIVHKLYTNNYSMEYHKKIISDNDRTIINLIWHENITHILNEIKNKKEKILVYKKILDNICIGDLMDRVIFQNQIWYLGEYSSLVKTFYNNYIIHLHMNNNILQKIQTKEIEFTKVLTKYSTEYNNNMFITQLCEKLLIDKKDLFWFFNNIVNTDDNKDETNIKCSNNYGNKQSNTDLQSLNNDSIYSKLNNCEITKLDINRIKKIIYYILGEN